MIVSTLFMIGFQYDKSVSEGRLEEEARDLGMHFEDECKVFFEGEKTND
ncbi:MAG: hypothetical protein RR620_06430 [Clostridium sp.]